MGRGDAAHPKPEAPMTRFRIFSLAVAVLVVVSSSYAIQRLAGPPAGDTTATPIPGVVTAGLQLPQLDRQIVDIESQLAEGNPSAHLSRFLGRLYLEKAQLTGDIWLYSLAERSLRQAATLRPGDPESISLLATAALATHDFQRAKALAQEALQWDPTYLDAGVILADSQIELGEYEEAAAGYNQLAVTAGGDAAVMVRLARLAFLRGETEAALSLATAAEASAVGAGGYSNRVAFYQAFLATLALDLGDYELARRAAVRAVATDPNGFLAQATLGSVEAALGNTERAIELYESATEAVPTPEYLAALGDLYVLADEPELASNAYEAVALLAGNGSVYNRHQVLFLADHNLDADIAVELAAAELVHRQDIFGYDSYAWALFRAGMYSEARQASDTALRLGTQDAAIYFHVGMISAALGERARAAAELQRALDISPQFDPLLAAEARATLEEVRS